MAIAVPFSGDTRPAITARGRTGSSGGSKTGTPLRMVSTSLRPAADQARRMASDTATNRTRGRPATASAASTRAGTSGGRWSVCSTGKPRSAASSSASASKACSEITSHPRAHTRANSSAKAGRSPGRGGGGRPAGITSARSTPAGAGTVSSRRPSRDEPAAQKTITSWPRAIRARARSVWNACAPPSCASRSGPTSDATIATRTAPSRLWPGLGTCPQQGQDLRPAAGIGPKAAEHAGGHGLAARLLDPAHLHAEVPRLHHHRHPVGPNHLLQGLRDLARHALLELQPMGVQADQARDLAQPHHPAAGKVGHVRRPEEGQEVVLAEGVELDVPDGHDLVVVLLEERVADRVADVQVVALGQVAQGPRHPLRRPQQALAGGVLPQPAKDLLHQPGQVVADPGKDAHRTISTVLFSDSTRRSRRSRQGCGSRSRAVSSCDQKARARFSAVGITPSRKDTSWFRCRWSTCTITASRTTRSRSLRFTTMPVAGSGAPLTETSST